MSAANQETVVYDPELVEEKHYWLARLSGGLEETFLPLDYPRHPIYLGAVGSLSVELPGALCARLRGLTKGSPFLLYVTLLAAYKVCLLKYSGHRKISVGSPAALGGEPAADAAPNVLVVVVEIDPASSFKDVLTQVRASLAEAYDRQRYSFGLLVADLKREGTLERSPFFDSVLRLEGLHGPLPELRNDLTLQFEEAGEGLSVTALYNQQLFEPETIERIIGHLLRVLEQGAENPGVAVARLSLPTAAERERLLVEWNRTAAPLPDARLLPQLFEEQAERSPEAVAVSCGGRRLTYAELNEWANRLAHHLRAQGVGPEAVVGLMVGRSPEMVVALLAVMKAGGAYVPLDPQSPPARLADVLADAQAGLLLTEEGLLGRLPPGPSRVLCLDRDAEVFARASVRNPEPRALPENLAYLIYTSGSTGRPKGVMVSHRGLLNYLLWARQAYPVAGGGPALVHTPLTFDLTVTSLFPALITGAGVELVPELPGVDGLLAALSVSRRYSLIKLTPSHLQLLNRQVEGRRPAAECGALVIGGEALAGEMVEPWQRESPQTRLFNEYGPTETVVGCCVHEVTFAQAADGPVPVGRPVANTRLYILDEFGEPVPAGVAGELYVGGEGVTRGYHRRPGLTAAAFVPDALSGLAGRRLYRTGDRALYMPDGQIVYLGRADAQIKLRGFRVEPGEIEYHLRQAAGVREAHVAVRKDRHGQDRLVAYVVPAEGQGAPSLREVRGSLQPRLPEYMIPAKLVACASLPLTPHGKVDARALPEPDWGEAVYGAEQSATPTEELLLGIWHDVLEVGNIGLDESFFGMGGHSLLATQVMSRVHEVWGVEIELRTLFERPTIRQLGQWLDERAGGGAGDERSLPPIRPRERAGAGAPLSYGQYRLWFLEQLAPGGSLYNVQLAIRLHGGLRLEALEWSLNRIVQRHEVLRSRFVLEEAGPVQVADEPRPLRLQVEDLTDLEPEAAEASAAEAIGREARRGFDLRGGQLIRALALRLSEDHHVVCLTMHHIVCDGWSTAVFVSEVNQLYTAYVRGEAAPLAELPIQYADYAAWQREWLSGERLDAELDYWRRQLAGAPARLELPTDRPRPSVQTSRGAVARDAWDAGLVSAARELSQKHGATQFMTMLTVLKILLYRYTGQEDIVVGSPIAGRTRRETEGLIGFFINALALRSRVGAEASFADLVRQEREVCLGAYAHQDVPFEKLVEELNPERELSHAPVFQVMLTLHNMPIGTLEMADLTFSPVETPVAGAKYDLTVRLVEVGGALNCSVEYNADLFEARTVERFTGHFRRLLAAVVAEPHAPVSRLPLLDEGERRQILSDWNQTAADYPRGVCVHHLFEEQARRRPEAAAVRFGGQSLTYGELNERADRLAALLAEQGVGPEVRVGLLVERSMEMPVGILAILKAGGVYVPLDPQYPRERLSFMARDAGLALTLTQERLAGELAGQGLRWLAIESAQLDGPAPPAPAPEPAPAGEHLAYMIYTSGSTGRPKGVMVEHRNLAHSTAARDIYYREPVGSFLLLSSFAFDSSVAGIFWTLTGGGTLVLPSRDFERDLSGLAGLIREQRVTTMLCLPSLYSFLLQQPEVERLHSLKTVIVAGEACPPALVARHRELMPQAKLFNEYGPTEASVWSSVLEVGGLAEGLNVPIGRPVPNGRMYVLDAHGQPAPVGVAGELYVGGEGVTRGYHRRPGLTAERFLPDPYGPEPGARLYRTGDLGRFLADGNVEFLGRADNQLKLRGYRIELGEIESALEAHPAVASAAVVSRDVVGDEPGDDRLVAYYVAAGDGAAPAPGDLRAHLRERLPDYMVPSVFMPVPALPRTPNGKLDRRALPAPAAGREGLATEFAPPADRLESLIAETWSELLQVKEVGVNDNFFELGGHSFLIIRVHDRLQKRLERQFPLLSVFEHPTVRALARFLQGHAAPAAPEAPAELPEEWASRRRDALRRRRLSRREEDSPEP
ncbi:MAG TPA: amino acid adenylation domain-containing protein [Pyrinomonadaceae bacterium]|nr:amino acid adenylation domain-containing protein [Pyrinomonadaceae bacterium]